MYQSYSFADNPVSLIMPASISVNQGQSASVDITANNYAAGLTIQAACESQSIAKVVGQPSFDASGKASFKIEGVSPGQTLLVASVPEAELLHLIPVTVTAIPDDGALLVTPGTGTEIMKGGTQAFTASYGGAPVTAAWSVSGGAKAGTAINASNGLLTIASDETSKELAVTATVGQASATVKIAVAATGNMLYGDVDGNGLLNRTDLALLRQHFAGWQVEINEAASDVTANGIVERADLAKLRQYFANWGVVLGQ
jgi:hypothetical protein